MKISNFIPFTQKFTIDTNRAYLKNDSDGLNFKIYGQITDRLIFLAGATIGLPVQLAATILLIAKAAIYCITSLFNDHFEGKQFLENYLGNFKYILAIAVGAVCFEVALIFGVFFPNNAKKICYSINLAVHEEAIFSSVFDPSQAPIARRPMFYGDREVFPPYNNGRVDSCFGEQGSYSNGDVRDCSKANNFQQGHNENDSESD